MTVHPTAIVETDRLGSGTRAARALVIDGGRLAGLAGDGTETS